MNEVKSEKLKERYFEETLPSGFKIILYPKPGIMNKGAFLTIGFGGFFTNFITRDGVEITHPYGSAHFLEHKLFENKKRNLMEEMGKLGSSVNAFTSHEITSFYYTAPLNFYEALKMHLEAPNSNYTEEGIEKERPVIRREIDLYLDNPDYRAFHNGLKVLYPIHPIGKEIAGTKESIELVTKETLDQILEHFYTPSNMFLFVIGDFKKEDMQKIIEMLPERYLVKKEEAKPIIPEDKTVPKDRLLFEEWDTELPSFSYLLKLEPIEDKALSYRRMVKYSIILDVLFGKGSDFFKDLYEKGLLNDLDVQYSYGPKFRFIHISGESKQPEVVREKIIETLQAVKEEGIPQDEIDLIKKKFLGRYLMGFNSISNIALQYMESHFNGVDMFTFPEIVSEIHIDDFKDLFVGPDVFSVIGRKKD
ncbi:EF-P 5-aminopentanol modification-associated protein YfmH [Guggenheimella bovis]